jgi:large subunit ribosomal protein L1
MPNPKTGTVTNDIAVAINELKKGRVEFRADKTGVIHLPVGKVSMEADKIAGNIEAFLAEMMRKKPTDAKADFVQSVSVSSSMGPGVWVAYKAGE